MFSWPMDAAAVAVPIETGAEYFGGPGYRQVITLLASLVQAIAHEVG